MADKATAPASYELSLRSQGRSQTVPLTPRTASDAEVTDDLATRIFALDMRCGRDLSHEIQTTLEASFGSMSRELSNDLMRACQAADAMAGDPRASAILVPA